MSVSADQALAQTCLNGRGNSHQFGRAQPGPLDPERLFPCSRKHHALGVRGGQRVQRVSDPDLAAQIFFGAIQGGGLDPAHGFDHRFVARDLL